MGKISKDMIWENVSRREFGSKWTFGTYEVNLPIASAIAAATNSLTFLAKTD
jgi:hypothetical protein